MTDEYKTKFHRDGTITLWDVYAQQWRRVRAVDAYDDDRLMATLSAQERARIERIALA